ncbi:MAG: methylated-DNA--[protein]-cysteine S-methyltransferase [Planctomycetes bacterium]|nr:methylated-DNA--[protein]-cysteine S-methyltransferase [Planctomycetota bacterium]
MLVSDYDRIGEALRYLDRNRRRTVPLGELAAAVGFSAFHFQRLFSRWTGISPTRLSRYLQLDDARALLRDARSVLDTTYAVGLSSPGRLHDLFVSIDAVTPGEFKTGGRGLTIDVGEHDSPFGRCLIGVTGRGICWLSFAGECGGLDGREQLHDSWPAATVRHKSSATAPLAAVLFRDRRPRARPPLKLLVGGTNFQLKVWEALIRIPPGSLVTYADVARAIGRPTAARAVGNAVGANRISYLIPCHRVIRSMGIVGEYRWGRNRKRTMIAWEAARSAASDAQ